MNDRLPSEIQHRTIGAYVESLANGSPTPGGGSAAAVAGAMGCSLGAMVCNLTLVRQPDETLGSLAQLFTTMAAQLIELAERDEQAFGSYRRAMALPRSTELEKAARRASIETALIGAAEVPLQMVELGATAIDRLRQAAELGTPHALGDLSTGGFLLEAMSLGALENIAANAASMKVTSNREYFEVAVSSARAALEAGMSGLQKAIESRRD